VAASRRTDHADLSELLFAHGYRFEFFQAVRLLQLAAPESVPVGEGDDPRREAIRFASDVSLAFAPSDIREVTRPTAEGPARLTVAFMGVATPASFGSLPTVYTEYVLSRLRERDTALRDFLDLFNHRLISLFYRAWAKYHFPIAYERGDDAGPGVFERALLSLLGLGAPTLWRDLPFDARLLLARASAFRRGRVSAVALTDLLEGYFGVPVAVEQFVPEWYVIGEEERSRLGRHAHQLGCDLTLGDRVQVAQARFRLRVGPLDWPAFQELLPAGGGFRSLVEMVRLGAGAELDFDLQLVLRPEAVPCLRLGVADEHGAPWLGWSTWLLTAQTRDAPAEVLIDAQAPRGAAA
jgi:type VI secretion system protein ImpH